MKFLTTPNRFMTSKKELLADAIAINKDKISHLPVGEIKYYLFLLVRSLENSPNTIKTVEFLNALSVLLDSLKKLHQENPLNPSTFKQVTEHYNQLRTIAQINSFSYQLKTLLLNVGGAILAFIGGFVGGLIGGISGFARGLYHSTGAFKQCRVGAMTGIFLGAAFCFRAPKKLFKDELVRQLQFGLNGFKRALEQAQQDLTNTTPISFQSALEVTKKEICEKCFSNNKEDFEQFLKSDVSYEINSFKAGFLGGDFLHGYLGLHAYIVIKIKNHPYLIEFTIGDSDINQKPVEQELRTVKGEKVVEMLAAHKQLQETTMPCNYQYMGLVLKGGQSMKTGDREDCFGYLAKIQVGTNQEPLTLAGFKDMNWVGSKIVGNCLTKLSPFPPNFYDAPPSVCKAGKSTFFSDPKGELPKQPSQTINPVC